MKEPEEVSVDIQTHPLAEEVEVSEEVEVPKDLLADIHVHPLTDELLAELLVDDSYQIPID